MYTSGNVFNEIKESVGMSLVKKENKKMHTPRQKVIHNLIPTSLFHQEFTRPTKS